MPDYVNITGIYLSEFFFNTQKNEFRNLELIYNALR